MVVWQVVRISVREPQIAAYFHHSATNRGLRNGRTQIRLGHKNYLIARHTRIDRATDEKDIAFRRTREAIKPIDLKCRYFLL